MLADLPAAATISTQLDLQVPPPGDAYAITGNYLPPFLQAVLLAWNHEFPQSPLTVNSIIFVIRPADFYSHLDPSQRAWLATREMLGIRNFPLIINPLINPLIPATTGICARKRNGAPATKMRSTFC